MNLQSNALKFTREGGKIKILAQYVCRKGKQQYGGKKSQFFSMLSSSDEKSSDSESSISFDKERKPDMILKSDDNYDKIVISVIDSGIGIKPVDKAKLFKLFGTL